MAKLLKGKILHCIREGLKGDYAEDNGEYGWWDNGDGGHHFEAETDKTNVCMIDWYGKGDPRNSLDIEGFNDDEMYFLQNVVNIEVIGNKLLITQEDGTETYIQ